MRPLKKIPTSYISDVVAFAVLLFAIVTIVGVALIIDEQQEAPTAFVITSSDYQRL